jgi:vacuolar-type H+-ATPase subunit E/Vma4
MPRSNTAERNEITSEGNENMSDKNETSNVNGTAVNAASLPDSSIYMSVEGYRGVLPWIAHEALSESENIAFNEGRKQAALRGAQPIAKQAAKAGKDVRAAVQAYLDGFEARTDMRFQTIGSKREELARELMAEKLKARGNATEATKVLAGEAVLNKAGENILPGFIAKYSEDINGKLSAWLAAYEAPKARGTKGAVTLDADGGFDLDSL